MNSDPSSADPFTVAFDGYDPEDERRRESVLSLGNGLLHSRSAAPEAGGGEAHYPGIYRAGLYAHFHGRIEGRDIAIESLVRLPDWLPLSFRPEGADRWFSLGGVTILGYRQTLDLKAAVLSRDMAFRDAEGRETLLTEQRFVSLARPHLLALRWTIEPRNWSGAIEIRSGIDGGVRNDLAAGPDGFDPHAFAVSGLSSPRPGVLLAEAAGRTTPFLVAVAVRTAASGEAPAPDAARDVRHHGSMIDEHVRRVVKAGEAIGIEKIAAYATSLDEAGGASPREAALAMLAEAPAFADLRAEHARAWNAVWARCPIEIREPELAGATRFHAFHLFQTVSHHSVRLDAGLPSRGWQEAYHGQIFWDETLSFPFLNLRFPDISRSLLLYRHRRLDAARRAARARGLEGAMYPWRSAGTGEEVTPDFQHNPLSGHWMADHTHLQHHVGSAIAFNTWNYVLATGDVDFLADHGAEMIVEIARLWASIARHDPATGRYDIGGAMGPDEFHTAEPGAEAPGLRNNAYTNIMAAWVLALAATVLDKLPPERAVLLRRRLNLRDEEPGRWDAVSRKLKLAFHGENIVSQFEGFERLRPFDLDAFSRSHPGGRVDWVLEAEGTHANEFQVLKQADFAMLLYLFPPEELAQILGRMGYEVSHDQLCRSVDHYLERTAHDSSLSDLVYAGALAGLAPERSWELYREALDPDGEEGHSGGEKGIHLGAMASTLDILQRHYLGIRPCEAGLAIDPVLPPGFGPMCLTLLFRGQGVTVRFDGEAVLLTADAGNAAAVPVVLRERTRMLAPGAALTVDPQRGEPARTSASKAVLAGNA